MKLLLCIFLTLNFLNAFAEDDPKVITKVRVTNEDFERLDKAIKSKNENETQEAISNILSKDPKNLKALNALAILYINTDKVGLARLVLERALKDHANSGALYNNLGVADLKEGNVFEAISNFKRSLQNQKRDNFAAANLASIYLNAGNYASSIGPLEDSYGDSSKDLSRGQAYAVQVANNYAVALARSGDYAKAANIYEKVMDGKTDDTGVMLNYAILMVRGLKKRKESIKILSKIKFVTEDPGILKMVSTLEKELDGLE